MINNNLKHLAILALAALSAVSCRMDELKDYAAREGEGRVTTLRVVIADPTATANPTANAATTTASATSFAETKTAVSEPVEGRRSVSWMATDKLMLNGVASNELGEVGAGGKDAQFSWEGEQTAPYRLLYPTSLYKDQSTITLPFSQNKMPGEDNLATDTFPMYGYSVGAAQSVDLKYLCAIVKIRVSVKADSCKLSYIEFRGNDDEQISGDFTLNYETGEMTGISANELSRSVKTFSIKKAFTDETIICNLVVPARTYANGFTVRVVDDKGKYMDQSTSASRTFEAGGSYAMPAFDFVPTENLDAMAISTPEQLIAFAQDFNAGKFEGTQCNVFLTADISFDETTSAAFEATGGIGTEKNLLTDDSNYYNGTFSGNGFSIQNLTTSVPLFAYTGGAANINSLTLDESCVITCPADGTQYFGAFVMRHKGNLNDCHCEAAIDVKGNSLDKARYVGGLIGRSVGGDCQNCSMDADIVLPITGDFTAKVFSVGGICGLIDSSAKIKDSQMNGKILMADEDNEFAGATFASYIYAGGIVGYAGEGTVSGCSLPSTAAIALHGSYKPYIGGIAGFAIKGASIKNCTNNAPLEFKSSAERAYTTPTYVGGIVGALGNSATDGGEIDGCTNNGVISSKCNSTTLALGGLAAFVSGEVCNSNNTGNITRYAQLTDNQANRYSSVGGAAGTFAKGSISHVENSGNLTYQGPGTATQTTVAMGGIVARINEGGETAVTISNCSNSGTVYENGGVNTTFTAWKATAGIVGYVSQPATISQCSNTGTVRFNYNTKANGRSSYVGGIVGVCGIYDSAWTAISGVTIQNCTNYGLIYNQNFNNTYDITGTAACGGIAGAILGKSDSKAQISNCNNLNSADQTGKFYCKRGLLGGIIGYASNTTVSNCASNKNTETYANNMPRYCGGIAGQLVNSSVEYCTVEGSFLEGSSSATCDMGGIAGTMDATSAISHCDVIDLKISHNDGTNFAKGAIVSTTASGSAISNCRISGGWSVDSGVTYTPFVLEDICSDANATKTDNSLYTRTYDLTGTVTGGGNPLAGVVVSDGYSCVQTGSDGKYYIKTNTDATCVSVSFPAGYEPAIINGLPSNYAKLSKVTPVDGIRTVDFALNEIANPDQFTIIAYADIQMRTSSTWGDNIGMRSGAVANDVFADIKECAQAKSGKIIGLSLGDQVNNAPEMYDIYVGDKNLGSLNFANYCIPGNHDYDNSKYDYIKALDAYEACLSPCRYSFNYGKFHFVMVDNARTIGPSSDPVTEAKGLPDPAWEWLQNDLKFVPKSTPIILCSHRPLFEEIYHDTSTTPASDRLRDISDRESLNTGYAALLASYKKVFAFNGDIHCSFNYVYTSVSSKDHVDRRNIEVHSLARATGSLWTNQFVNDCGTPRGYLVMNVNGTDLTYKFKPVAIQTASPFNSPSSMTYRDFTPSVGNTFYMKSSYLSNPKAKLDDFYQIHAYAPGAYTEKDGAYAGDVIATVFMYDSRWSKVTFECAAGTFNMKQFSVSDSVHDPCYTWLRNWYVANAGDSYFKSNYNNDHAAYNMFHITPADGVRSGTVKVTDHFGNTYEYKLAW